MSNIRITDLPELTTIDINKVFIYGANTDSSNTSHKIRISSISSLTDYSIANAAFLRANVAYNTGFNANNALLIAQLAYTQANSSFVKANLAYNHADAGYSYANSVYIHANAAYGLANSSLIYSTAGFNTANAGLSVASAAFNTANGALAHATAAYNSTNTINGIATSAFNRANSAFDLANAALPTTGGSLTGVVNAPTAANNTSNTMLATTQFVQNSISVRNSGLPVVRAYAVVSVSGSTASLVRGYNIATVTRLDTGRFLITYSSPLSSAEYAVSTSVSTFNPGETTRNFDHTINIESTSTTSIVINTGDPGAENNNRGHDPSKFWITVFE